ncbi:hypothetical protein LZZ85_10575 [Terrimonas sp. NA20]|uniref:Uncharacterized protein n=1 Tax=Terrimonas ginsenosidimutans TaxID=2908004 RepID=A0ABS9KR12_9BACT|nr:hypothetical protein [Terrimonas ginsenosidimutans]MCG2614729.1 hypothetical protein [Terrimonas ginsenosidimutans]
MTEDLKISIETLYRTFSVYPFRNEMEVCQCCFSEADKEKLYSKHLKDLETDDLSGFAFKAMTTWGGVDDFKHFLPRIFELLAADDFTGDAFVVLEKLEYGKWKEWPEIEKDAIIGFLWVWWEDMVRSKPYFDKEAFTGIYKLTDDIDRLLDIWTIDLNDHSFSNFVDFVYSYFSDLKGKRAEFKDLDNAEIDKIINWTKANSGYFETGFFYFLDKDNELAEKASIAQFIFEHSGVRGN